MNKSPIIGIDFGTSNSAVSCSLRSSPELVELEPGKTSIPSAIFLDATGSDALFGGSAIEAYVAGQEGRLFRSLKSILGSSLYEGSTELGTTQIQYKELLELFFRNLKKVAEKYLSMEVTSAVIGRPVWFVDDSPEADAVAQNQLTDIAHNCGFNDVYFQFEPIAAALNYERSIEGEELGLVADIGGGTADFSLIRMAPSRHRDQDRSKDILANTGVHVGGTDLDRALSLLRVMPHFGYGSRMKQRPELQMPVGPFLDLATWYRIQLLYSRTSIQLIRELHVSAEEPGLLLRLLNLAEHRDGHHLAADLERAKINLAQGSDTLFAPPYVQPELRVQMTAADLQAAVDRLGDRIVESIRGCVTDAGISAEEVDSLVLTGGTTAVPSIRRLCSEAVPNARLVETDLFGSVALGLAVDGSILTEG